MQAAWRGQLSRRHICGVLVVHVTGGAGLPVPLLRKINPYVALEVLDGHRKVCVHFTSFSHHIPYFACYPIAYTSHCRLLTLRTSLTPCKLVCKLSLFNSLFLWMAYLTYVVSEITPVAAVCVRVRVCVCVFLRSLAELV